MKKYRASIYKLAHKWFNNNYENNMKVEHSLEYQEKQALEKILPELMEHLDYSTKVYNCCFKIQHFLDNKTINEVGQLLRSQMMILTRITDFLRCIQHTIVLGYPEQAGTLAGSIFELTHTAIYFTYDIAAMQKWLSCSDDNAKMPKLIGKNTYRELVVYNCEQLGLDSKQESAVYSRLCWMKHSHPILQDILVDNGKAKFRIGPYTDETSIGLAWFTIETSGRLTEILISRIKFPGDLLSDSQLKAKDEMLSELCAIRYNLTKKAQKKFDKL